MSEWRDITTAPRDGSEVILRWRTSGGLPMVALGWWDHHERRWLWRAGADDFKHTLAATAWMPFDS